MPSQLSPPADVPRPGLLSPDGPFGCFAGHLLARELPDLGDDRRTETVAFVCRRAAQMPTPLRLGLTTLSLGVAASLGLVGPERTTTMLQSTSLPFVGELARVVRSLGFAYIWETWPDTSPTGGAAC